MADQEQEFSYLDPGAVFEQAIAHQSLYTVTIEYADTTFLGANGVTVPIVSSPSTFYVLARNYSEAIEKAVNQPLTNAMFGPFKSVTVKFITHEVIR